MHHAPYQMQHGKYIIENPSFPFMHMIITMHNMSTDNVIIIKIQY